MTELEEEFHNPIVESQTVGETQTKVHIRMQMRNGRKCITTVEGLADDLDLVRITKACKKSFYCNGNVIEDEDHGEIIQFSGDQRYNVRSFLLQEEICSDTQIVVHGG